MGLTRSKSTTVLISPLDMLGLMGMAQVLAAVAYGIKGVRRGQTTWQWPKFCLDPERENSAQMADGLSMLPLTGTSHHWQLPTNTETEILINSKDSDIGWCW